MAYRERDKGKRKVYCYEVGESSASGARRMRARTMASPGGEAGDTSLSLLGSPDGGTRVSSPLLPQRQPAAHGGADGDDPMTILQTQYYFVPQVPTSVDDLRAGLAALNMDNDRESGGVGNPGALTPPPRTGTPSSWSWSQMNVDGTNATAGQSVAAPGASGSGQSQPPPAQQVQSHPPAAPTNNEDEDGVLYELERLITINLLENPFPVQATQPSVADGQICPGCLERPGSFTMVPSAHCCLCDVCKKWPFICPICANGLAAA